MKNPTGGQASLLVERQDPRVEAFFANTLVAVCEATCEGRIVRANDELGRLTGRSAEALLKLRLEDLIHPEDPLHEVFKEDHLDNSQDGVAIRHRMLQPDGQVVWATSSLTRFQHCDGDRRLLLVTVDDTARKRGLTGQPATSDAEHAGRQASWLLETVTDATIAFDADWRYTHVNAAAESFLRRSRHDLIGRVCWDVFPQMRGHRNTRSLLRAMTERRTIRWESLSDYTGHWIHWACYPLPDGGVAMVSGHRCSRSRRARAARQ